MQGMVGYGAYLWGKKMHSYIYGHEGGEPTTEPNEMLAYACCIIKQDAASVLTMSTPSWMTVIVTAKALRTGCSREVVVSRVHTAHRLSHL